MFHLYNFTIQAFSKSRRQCSWTKHDELFCACIIDRVERLMIVLRAQVRVLRILVCTHCRPLLTAVLDSVSPQFLRDFDARRCFPTSSPDFSPAGQERTNQAYCLISHSLQYTSPTTGKIRFTSARLRIRPLCLPATSDVSPATSPELVPRRGQRPCLKRRKPVTGYKNGLRCPAATAPRIENNHLDSAEPNCQLNGR